MHARHLKPALVALLVSAGATACAGENESADSASAQNISAPESTSDVNVTPVDPASAMDAALAGDHRSDEARARDAWRHPKETLMFFGVEPDMSVVEIWPGGGWYTDVIAPYLKTGGGVFYAAGFPRNERTGPRLDAFEEKYVDNPSVYGTVRMTTLGGEDHIAPEGGVDVVLTFRNVHNWGPSAPDYFAEFYRALKPGGVLGVVEHRADEEGEPNGGYVKESRVRELAEAAGFEFEDSAEINANPADTKDHPYGVWTLPPVRRSTPASGIEDPDFDRAKYDAIGESDRMTMKFRKPIAADGALLE